MDNTSIIALGDAAYPKMLAQIHDPPEILFVRGDLSCANNPCVAIVGPRANSDYGKYITELFVPPLVNAGFTIISGLALGIDGIAHKATIDAGGKTIAVLGSGIDDPSITPSSHLQLAHRIIESGGAVISEYPPGTEGAKFTYPRRNRIVAGLSLGALVVEAGFGSGALITASSALDSNREVFAVPQNITSLSANGVNELIKSGAHLVTKPEDILEILGFEKMQDEQKVEKISPSSPIESSICELLSREPTHIDLIIKQTKLQSHIVMSALTTMEMKGMVQNLGGMMYIRA